MLISRSFLPCVVPLALALPMLVVTQSFPQTSEWRKPLINLSYDDRQALAQNALTVVARQIDFEKGVSDALSTQIPQSAMLLYTMAEYDHRTNSTIFQANVTSALETLANTARYNFTYMVYASDQLRLGLAYYSAHLAYLDTPQGSDFLKAAIALWEAARVYFVSESAAIAGTVPGIPAFNSTCVPLSGGAPISTAGALSWQGSTQTNGEIIGPWVALSSFLYTTKLNATYLEAATTSLQFGQAFLSNGTMVWDTYDFRVCSPTTPPLWASYNGGYFLQALTAYHQANASSVNTQTLAYLNELAASLIVNPKWTNLSDGINIEDSNIAGGISGTTDWDADWKAIFVTGLYQCLKAGLLNDTVANLTQQYISVQFNAVRELANYTLPSIIGQPVYGPSWKGTPEPLTDLDPPGQLAAAELFTTAMGIGPESTNNTSTNLPSPTVPSHPQTQAALRAHSRVGTIVGSVASGVVAFVGAFVGVLCWRRRKRTVIVPLINSQAPGHASGRDSVLAAEPYFATIDQYPISERSVTFARHDGGPGSLTKRQHMPRSATTSSSGITELRTNPDSPISLRGLTVQQSQRGEGETVRVDEDVLRQLLLRVGGGEVLGTGTTELPPDYESLRGR